MACQGCGSSAPNFTQVFNFCKVCELVDGNIKEKPVAWCETCHAYICSGCWNNPIRRGAAFSINIVNKITEAFT